MKQQFTDVNQQSIHSIVLVNSNTTEAVGMKSNRSDIHKFAADTPGIAGDGWAHAAQIKEQIVGRANDLVVEDVGGELINSADTSSLF